ncbi:hypothetical protein ES703_14178 [subsurface metagenome]
MRTYKQGYDWATTLTVLIDADVIDKKPAIEISKLSADHKHFKQGMIDSCNDWLHKMRIYEKEQST